MLKDPRDIQRPITGRRRYSVAGGVMAAHFRFRFSGPRRTYRTQQRGVCGDSDLPGFVIRHTACTFIYTSSNKTLFYFVV